MALSLASPPDHGFDIVNRTASLAEGVVPFSITRKDVEQVIAPPQPLYTADVMELEKGFLRSAELTGWSYLIFSGEDAEAIAELAWDRLGTESRLSFAELHPRESAALLANTIAIAEEEADARGGSYDLRLVRIPEVYFFAVWLAGSEDLLFPVPPAPSRLRGRVLWTEKDVAAALLPLARSRTADTEQDVAEEVTSAISEPAPIEEVRRAEAKS